MGLCCTIYSAAIGQCSRCHRVVLVSLRGNVTKPLLRKLRCMTPNSTNQTTSSSLTKHSVHIEGFSSCEVKYSTQLYIFMKYVISEINNRHKLSLWTQERSVNSLHIHQGLVFPVSGIPRVTSFKVLGVTVTITNALSAFRHVRGVVTNCSQTLYALRALHSHGMSDSALQIIIWSVGRCQLGYSTRAVLGGALASQMWPTCSERIPSRGAVFHTATLSAWIASVRKVVPGWRPTALLQHLN